MPSRWAWRRADVALAWLILLATFSAWLALTLSTTSLESILALVVTICRRSWGETLAHGADLGRLSLLLPLTIGLFLALGEARRLMLATRHWIDSLTSAGCTPSRRLNRLAHKCGLAGRITLVRSGRPLVFTHGFIHPRVWISTGLIQALGVLELEAVLRHEAHHKRARDPLKILIVRCLSRALFFAPVARDLCDAYCVAKEIAADEAATRAMRDALPLASALRKLLATRFHASPELALVSELGVTEVRLLALLDSKRAQPLVQVKHLGVSLLWLLLVVGIFLAPVAGHLPSFSECTVQYTLGNYTQFWP